MSQVGPCFPVIEQINNARTRFFDINYDHSDLYNVNVPLAKSVVAWFSHKTLTVISIPANTAAVSIATLGIASSCILAATKVALYIFTGHKFTFPTGFLYFSDAFIGSIYQIFKTAYENLFEIYYRIDSCWEKIVSPQKKDNESSSKEPKAENNKFKTLPLVEGLNNIRCSLREGETSVGKWFSHKFISVISIPTNLLAIGLSTAWMGISTVLVAAKVALYILTGIQIRQSTGFVRSFKAIDESLYQTILNLGELGKDSVYLVRDTANFVGLTGVSKRATEFLMNAFGMYSAALS